jgi:hypothetical protein
MKGMRRVSIEIRQRETSVSIRTSGQVEGGEVIPRDKIADGEKRGSHGPASCPVCGSAGMLPFADAVVEYRCGADALSQGLTQGKIHLCRTGGSVWLCEQTLRAFLSTALPQPGDSP